MTAQPELERAMAKWLAIEASTTGRERVLAAALARVASSRQERFLTQRILGDRVGRVPAVRRALALGLLVVAAATAVAAAGAILKAPLIVLPTHVANGAITYAAGGDLYVVEPGTPARRIVGTDGDTSDRGCQAYSLDGLRFAFVEASTPWDTADSWSIVTSAVDAHGMLQGTPSRISLSGSLTDCPVSSADLRRVAYVRPAFEGGDLVLVELANGSDPAVLVPGPGNGPTQPKDDFSLGPLAWSPDGEGIAFVRSSGPNLQRSEIWVTGVVGASPPTLIARADAGTVVNALAWSPDGRLIAASAHDGPHDADLILIMPPSGLRSSPTTIDGASSPAWSPDGRRIAFTVAGGVVVQVLADGTRMSLPDLRLDRPVTLGAPSWSPDGEWLLMDASDAPFVDRGVSYTVVAVDPDGVEPPIVLAPWKLGFHRDLRWQGVTR